MKLTDFVRAIIEDVGAVFESLLPAVVWQGNGRKPWGNRETLTPQSGPEEDRLPSPGRPTHKQRLNTTRETYQEPEWLL